MLTNAWIKFHLRPRKDNKDLMDLGSERMVSKSVCLCAECRMTRWFCSAQPLSWRSSRLNYVSPARVSGTVSASWKPHPTLRYGAAALPPFVSCKSLFATFCFTVVPLVHLQNVPPDLAICTFILEQSLSVRALQEMLANTVEMTEVSTATKQFFLKKKKKRKVSW